MKFVLRALPLAEQELADAVRWYEGVRAGLGADFLLCVDEAIARLLENPYAYPVFDDTLRILQVYRFPYRIYYRVASVRVEILGVYHTSRRPIDWQERM